MKSVYWLAGAAVALAATPAQAEWVASWTASPHAPLGTQGPFAAASYENVTISQILRISEGGDKVRVKFSNRYGAGPLEIGAARRSSVTPSPSTSPISRGSRSSCSCPAPPARAHAISPASTNSQYRRPATSSANRSSR